MPDSSTLKTTHIDTTSPGLKPSLDHTTQQTSTNPSSQSFKATNTLSNSPLQRSEIETEDVHSDSKDSSVMPSTNSDVKLTSEMPLTNHEKAEASSMPIRTPLPQEQTDRISYNTEIEKSISKATDIRYNRTSLSQRTGIYISPTKSGPSRLLSGVFSKPEDGGFAVNSTNSNGSSTVPVTGSSEEPTLVHVNSSEVDFEAVDKDNKKGNVRL